MFAGINVLLAAFVYFFVPETKNVMLEEMDAKFGGANHVDSGGKMMGVDDAHHAEIGRNGSLEKDTGAEHIAEVKN